MPFEPRIHNHDESSESAPGVARPEDPVWDDAAQLDLPDDLAMLAEQLRDDAVYLAQKHPADATSEERELAWKEFVESKSTTPQFAFPRRWVTTAAALVAVIAVGGWAIYMNQPTSTEESAYVAGELGAPSVAAPVAAPANMDNVNQTNQVQPVELPGTQPRLIPASFLQDVSGPELDGMLDLLEEDESGLSI